MAKSSVALILLIACLCAAGLSDAGRAEAQAPGASEKPAASEAAATAESKGANAGWQTEVTNDTAGDTANLSAEDLELIRQVNDYFNLITDLQGTFVQTSSENELTNGKFFVKRPGRLRFDYSAPSRLRIVVDGEWLTIEDEEDPANIQRVGLSQTPFRMLLTKDVNLLRDANILGIARGEDVVILTLADKREPSTGQIKLFFSIPELELKEWIVTDSQGLDTRVEIANLDRDQIINPKLFEPSEFKLPDSQN